MTTLKKSVAAAEIKLEEERNGVKRLRREHKSHLANLRKELDTVTARFAASGSGDDRQRHRLQQIGQHIRQAEDATAAMCSQTEAMGEVPEEELSEWRESKKTWEAARKRHTEMQEELDERAMQLDRQRSSLQSESSAMQQRRERVQARQAKLKDQHDRLNEVKIPSQEEKERAAAASINEDEEQHQRMNVVDQYNKQMQQLHHNLQDLYLSNQHLWQQIRSIEMAYRDQQQQQQQLVTSAPSQAPLPSLLPPHLIESGFSGVGGLANTTIPYSNLPRYGNYTLPAIPSASPSSSIPSPHMPLSSTSPTSSRSAVAAAVYHDGRVRSSSMRSSRSAFPEYMDSTSTAPSSTVAGQNFDPVINGMDHVTREMARGGEIASGGGGAAAAGGAGMVNASGNDGRSRSGSHRDASTSPFSMSMASSSSARSHPVYPTPPPHPPTSTMGKGSSPVWP